MSDGSQVRTTRTRADLSAFAAAMRAAQPRVWGTDATASTIAMFWAQHQAETGGKDSWCWNIGNVKKFDGDGHDWCYLNGVWECLPAATAERMILTKEARRSTTEWHKCPPGRVAVVFDPPHKTCRFRAFASLDRATYEHLILILDRWPGAWPCAERGDVAGFVANLKGYFTASPAHYVRGMQPHFDSAVATLGSGEDGVA